MRSSTAESGEEAIEQLSRGEHSGDPFKLILTDMVMPEMDGFTLVERIRQLLVPSGVLICRLNSTNDHHFGASGHPRIDDGYYLVDGEPKRFFDREATTRLFAHGWHTLSLEEGVIDRYDHPKWVWEAALEKIDR